MTRTKLRFLFAPLWIMNMIFLFGILFDSIPKNDGQISTRLLASICLPFVFFIYLIKDVLLYKRVVFVKIAAVVFLASAAIYISISIYISSIYSLFYIIIIVPCLLSGTYMYKSTKT